MRQKEDILNYFQILKKRNHLGPAYLFIGDDSSLVVDIAKTVNCRDHRRFCDVCWDCRKIGKEDHPDLFIVEPEGLTTKINAIKEAGRFLSLKSFCAENKILIIKDGLSLSAAAANAFLKTLEEPPDNSFIAVCASKTEGLIPTIISRCRKIFLPYPEEKGGRLDVGPALDFLKGQRVEFKNRHKFSGFLWTLIVLLRDALVSQTIGDDGSSQGERVFGAYSVKQLSGLLLNALMVYESRASVNINLGLNVIKAAL